MTPGQRHAAKAIRRAAKALEDCRIELIACARELGEAEDMDAVGAGNEEKTSPGTPRSKSGTLAAVTEIFDKAKEKP